MLLDKNINLKNMSSDQIHERFKEAKPEVETTEKAIQSELTPMSYVRDFVRAHEPTGKYRDIDKIEIKTKESIANDISMPTKISDNKQLAAEACKIVSKYKVHNKPKRNITRKSQNNLS